MITIDEIELPMRSIEQLPTSRQRALTVSNSFARSKEPDSTEQATQRVVRILDANYTIVPAPTTPEDTEGEETRQW